MQPGKVTQQDRTSFSSFADKHTLGRITVETFKTLGPWALFVAGILLLIARWLETELPILDGVKWSDENRTRVLILGFAAVFIGLVLGLLGWPASQEAPEETEPEPTTTSVPPQALAAMIESVENSEGEIGPLVRVWGTVEGISPKVDIWLFVGVADVSNSPTEAWFPQTRINVESSGRWVENVNLGPPELPANSTAVFRVAVVALQGPNGSNLVAGDEYRELPETSEILAFQDVIRDSEQELPPFLGCTIPVSVNEVDEPIRFDLRDCIGRVSITGQFLNAPASQFGPSAWDAPVGASFLLFDTNHPSRRVVVEGTGQESCHGDYPEVRNTIELIQADIRAAGGSDEQVAEANWILADDIREIRLAAGTSGRVVLYGDCADTNLLRGANIDSTEVVLTIR